MDVKPLLHDVLKGAGGLRVGMVCSAVDACSFTNWRSSMDNGLAEPVCEI